jgi:hypothetical protein
MDSKRISLLQFTIHRTIIREISVSIQTEPSSLIAMVSVTTRLLR